MANLKQRVENVQSFMFTFIFDDGEFKIPGVTGNLVLKQILQNLDKNNRRGYFKINSIEFFGAKAAQAIVVRDAINREITSLNSMNSVNVPLFPLGHVINVKSTRSEADVKELVTFDPRS